MITDSNDPGADSHPLEPRAPSIAIVVPVYNVAMYVEATLESVRQQSVAPDEVIIIDDGSTDGTAEILNKYVGLPDFQVIKTKNNGLGPARNLGRMFAKSQYVYFLDSDDLIKEDLIEQARNTILKNDYPDVILFAGETFHDQDYKCDFSPIYRRTIEGEFGQRDKLLTQLVRGREASCSPCLFISKTSLWSEHRLAFPPIIHEDEAIFFPLLALSKKTVAVPKVFFMQRVRPGSIMTSKPDHRYALGMLRVMHETLEFMAREPALVAQELPVWRDRMGRLAVKYVFLCRKTATKIDSMQTASALITARSSKQCFRVIYHLLPDNTRKLIRALTKAAVQEQKPGWRFIAKSIERQDRL